MHLLAPSSAGGTGWGRDGEAAAGETVAKPTLTLGYLRGIPVNAAEAGWWIPPGLLRFEPEHPGGLCEIPRGALRPSTETFDRGCLLFSSVKDEPRSSDAGQACLGRRLTSDGVDYEKSPRCTVRTLH